LKNLAWNPGAEHTIRCTMSVQGYTLFSALTGLCDPTDPLVFKLVPDQGYVYQRGKGFVVTPAGDIASLGYR